MTSGVMHRAARQASRTHRIVYVVQCAEAVRTVMYLARGMRLLAMVASDGAGKLTVVRHP